MIEFDLSASIPILARTPEVLSALLSGLPKGWTSANEGGGTWSAFDVVGHLIHGEQTDWIPRARIMLDSGESKPFPVFDRFAQFEASKGKTLSPLLDEFTALRAQNVAVLRSFSLTPEKLARTGIHPELGVVTLSQHLATWVVHDLDHLTQIARVMAKRYGDAVGPWRPYLSVLGDRVAP